MLDGFVAAAGLGLGDGLGVHLAKAAHGSPWVEAAARISEGRYDVAGMILEESCAYAYSAMVRLLEAELTGHGTPGLRAAVEFYESVGATAYLARAERLLQASA